MHYVEWRYAIYVILNLKLWNPGGMFVPQVLFMVKTFQMVIDEINIFYFSFYVSNFSFLVNSSVHVCIF